MRTLNYLLNMIHQNAANVNSAKAEKPTCVEKVKRLYL